MREGALDYCHCGGAQRVQAEVCDACEGEVALAEVGEGEGVVVAPGTEVEGKAGGGLEALPGGSADSRDEHVADEA